MKIAVIWDLDGTLLDSYDVIVESIFLTFCQNGIVCSKEEIHRYAISSSISALFAEYAEKYNIDMQLLKDCYSRISGSRYLDIKVMKQGREVLQALADRGVEQYVFTHRGKTTFPVLDNLELTHFFRDIITSQHSFPRKPDPLGLRYFIEKYVLDEAHTYYVGDRYLDMECAKNAGISGVLYMPDGSFDVTGAERYRIKELLEILKLV